MSTLTITRGLPGSGKSTRAHLALALEPDTTMIVNRDSSRLRLFGSADQDYYECSKDALHRKEALVTEANHAAIKAGLKAGFHVIVDDTNLPARTCRELRAIARREGSHFEVWDLSDVPLGTCLERNENRKDKQSVPRSVIENMYSRYVKRGLAPIPEDYEHVFRPYVRDTSKPKAILVDTDGTVANHKPHRGPYDTSKYHLDTPIQDVIEVVQAISWLDNITIIGLSGRSEEFREVTGAWWDENVGFCPEEFYMRPTGDDRKDTIIKSELFDKYIADRYNVIGVIDDRPSVCRMWREKGLTTFQVGDPDIDF